MGKFRFDYFKKTVVLFLLFIALICCDSSGRVEYLTPESRSVVGNATAPGTMCETARMGCLYAGGR